MVKQLWKWNQLDKKQYYYNSIYAYHAYCNDLHNLSTSFRRHVCVVRARFITKYNYLRFEKDANWNDLEPPLAITKQTSVSAHNHLTETIL